MIRTTYLPQMALIDNFRFIFRYQSASANQIRSILYHQYVIGLYILLFAQFLINLFTYSLFRIELNLPIRNIGCPNERNTPCPICQFSDFITSRQGNKPLFNKFRYCNKVILILQGIQIRPDFRIVIDRKINTINDLRLLNYKAQMVIA